MESREENITILEDRLVDIKAKIFQEKLNILAEKMFGEFGFYCLNEEQQFKVFEKVIKDKFMQI